MSVTYRKYIFLGGLVPVLPPLFLCHKTAPKFFLWGKGGAGCGKIRLSHLVVHQTRPSVP